MITRININGIPPFNKTELETDKKVNLIYGLNGTGKSTISNLLYDLNHDACLNNALIEFDNGIDTINSYEFVVYNQRFVQDVFYESSEIKGIFSLSKDNAAAQAAIDNANSEKTKLENQKTQKETEKADIKNELIKAKNDITEKVWEIKTNYSGGDRVFDFCLEGLKREKSRLFSHIESVKKSEDKPERTIDDIQKELTTLLNDKATELSLLSPLDDLSGIENNELLTKIIVGNENSTVADFINEINNSDWVKQGLKYLPEVSDNKQGKCPFCQKETIDVEFIREIKSFFGGAYEQDLESLNGILEQYQSSANSIEKYTEFDTYSILLSLKADYESAYAKLRSILSENINLIKSKIEKPSVPVQLKSSSEYLTNINEIIEKANNFINIFNEKIRKKDSTLNLIKDEFWNIMKWQYDDAIQAYNKEKKTKEQRIGILEKDVLNINTNISTQDEIIRIQQSKTVNIDDAIDHINAALFDMGIADFKIVKHSDTLYRLAREGQKDDVFKSLSEGEKMIISLLYFIELCKGKVDREKGDKKRIIVIDDPISSLSHIFVYNVGRLLIQEFTDANPNNNRPQKYEQVFLLTHSLYFFYEMAIVHRKNKDDNNQKLFRLQKNQDGSHIIEMKYSEIQNDYHAYWMIIKDRDSHPALIANCMRNIIEYFFAFVEKKELNNVFDNPALQEPKYRAFNRYINRESHSLGHNIFDIKEFNYDDFKEAFQLVFKLTGYEDHYNRMMK